MMKDVYKFPSSASLKDILEYYDKYKVVHVKKILHERSTRSLSLNDIIYKNKDDISNNWTIENEKETSFHDKNKPFQNINDVGYISKISQKESEQNDTKKNITSNNDEYDRILNCLPIQDFSLFHHGNLYMKNIQITNPIWFFCGRCNKKITGRDFHADSMTHDGTFHVQCIGSKDWYIKPADTTDWRDNNNKSTVPVLKNEHIKIHVESGDFFMLNTRAWFHKTEIPITGKRSFSVSYARDFYLKMDNSNDDNNDTNYINVDSLYAIKPIKKNEIILTEDEMPNCSLMRNADPSCSVEIIKIPRGRKRGKECLALIANRDMDTGEFFTIAPSDDDDDGDDDEGEDEDDDINDDDDEEDM